MELYFLKTDNFLKKLDEEFLLPFKKEKASSCEKRQNEYALGRFLLNYVLKNYYDINEPRIIIKNEKPVLETEEVFFSLSHTKNIVAVVFDDKQVGLDVEYMKDRDFKKLSERYPPDIKECNKEAFYDFWTKYEAEIKLQEAVRSLYSSKFFDEWYMSITSSKCLDIEEELKVYEIVFSPSEELERVLYRHI